MYICFVYYLCLFMLLVSVSMHLIKSGPLTTNVVSSNSSQARCIRHNIMWKSLSVTWGRSVVFFPGIRNFSTNKTDRHDITEILLKVALNTRTLTLNPYLYKTNYKCIRKTSFSYISTYKFQVGTTSFFSLCNIVPLLQIGFYRVPKKIYITNG